MGGSHKGSLRLIVEVHGASGAGMPHKKLDESHVAVTGDFRLLGGASSGRGKSSKQTLQNSESSVILNHKNPDPKTPKPTTLNPKSRDPQHPEASTVLPKPYDKPRCPTLDAINTGSGLTSLAHGQLP